MSLFGTVIGLAILVGVEIVLGLGHSVPTVGVLVPGLLGVGSTLGVEGGVVLENSGLLCVSVVVGVLLLLFGRTNLLVLGFAQAGGNVGLAREISSLNL